MSYYSGGYKIAEGGKILASALGITIEAFTTPWNASASTLADLNETTYTFTVPDGVISFTAHVWGGGGSSTQNYGNGGYSSATFACTPGDKYKVIPARGAENSNNNGADSYSEGGYGIGGGSAQDGNDVGAGGAGSGIFYCGSGSTSATSATTIFTKGVLIAGGGAVGRNGQTAGAGNGGTESAVTVYSVAGRGKAGGNGSGPGYGGFADGRGGGWSGNGNSVGTAAFGSGGPVGVDGYGGGYGGGAGGGAGGGGGGGGTYASSGGGENATGWGGRGSDEYDNNYNGNTGPGAGGDFNSTGGNGFRWNPASCNLGGGGGGSHGSASGAGGFGGGGGGYYANAGGGGSGCAFGYTGTPTLSTWLNPSSVQLDIFGDEMASAYISTSAGTGRANSSAGSAPNGAIIITY
jgi:hypothetical protein